jgi:ATP-dependent Zn protease
VTERYEYSKKLLMDNRALLEKVATVLLDKETLDAVEIDAVFKSFKEDMQKPEFDKDANVAS